MKVFTRNVVRAGGAAKRCNVCSKWQPLLLLLLLLLLLVPLAVSAREYKRCSKAITSG